MLQGFWHHSGLNSCYCVIIYKSSLTCNRDQNLVDVKVSDTLPLAIICYLLFLPLDHATEENEI
jgi:hypothetical protein